MPVAEFMSLAAPVAVSVIATLKNGMDALKTWFDIGDKKEARRQAKKILEQQSVEKTESLPEIIEEGQRLLSVVPEDILRSFQERTEKCWSRYSHVLGSAEYLPDEVDEATQAVIACVCRELNRLFEVNKSIPEGTLKKYWETYSCFTKRQF
jgi:type I restriction enzyme, R subunit